jgi:hypothetical protein
MPQLQIYFTNLFLIVNRSHGATALAPAQGHQVKIYSSLGLPGSPQGHVVTLCNANGPLSSPVQKPNGDYMLDLNQVTELTGYRVKKNADLDNLVSLRVELGRESPQNIAWFQDAPAPSPNEIRQYRIGKLQHTLTNLVIFTINLDPKGEYSFRVDKGGQTQQIQIPTNKGDLEVLNSEMGLIYELLETQNGGAVYGPPVEDLGNPNSIMNAFRARLKMERTARAADLERAFARVPERSKDFESAVDGIVDASLRMLCIDPVCPNASATSD